MFLKMLLLTFAFVSIANAGNFSGDCEITDKNGDHVTHSFSLESNQMAVVGAFGKKVSVVNNVGTPYANAFYALAFAISHDIPGGWQNPPELCVTSPIEEAQACQERNRRNFPPHVPASTDRFTLVTPNKGTVEYAVLDRNINEQWDGRTLETTLAAISTRAVRDGLRASKAFVLDGVQLKCDVVYSEL